MIVQRPPIGVVREPLEAGAPYVVVFFYEGTELRARIRNIQSQEQWVMRGASVLRDVLANVTIKAAAR